MLMMLVPFQNGGVTLSLQELKFKCKDATTFHLCKRYSPFLWKAKWKICWSVGGLILTYGNVKPYNTVSWIFFYVHLEREMEVGSQSCSEVKKKNWSQSGKTHLISAFILLSIQYTIYHMFCSKFIGCLSFGGKLTAIGTFKDLARVSLDSLR